MITKAHARLLRAKIVKASESLTDTDALQAVELFAEWKVDVEYKKDVRVRYAGKLYKCRQQHTSQSQYPPPIVPALWEEVKEQGQGTKDNPIPYNNNMALEEGLYYIQYDVEYFCFRSTGVPVYNDLSALVGLYVEVVE